MGALPTPPRELTDSTSQTAEDVKARPKREIRWPAPSLISISPSSCPSSLSEYIRVLRVKFIVQVPRLSEHLPAPLFFPSNPPTFPFAVSLCLAALMWPASANQI